MQTIDEQVDALTNEMLRAIKAHKAAASGARPVITQVIRQIFTLPPMLDSPFLPTGPINLANRYYQALKLGKLTGNLSETQEHMPAVAALLAYPEIANIVAIGDLEKQSLATNMAKLVVRLVTQSVQKSIVLSALDGEDVTALTKDCVQRSQEITRLTLDLLTNYPELNAFYEQHAREDRHASAAFYATVLDKVSGAYFAAPNTPQDPSIASLLALFQEKLTDEQLPQLKLYELQTACHKGGAAYSALVDQEVAATRAEVFALIGGEDPKAQQRSLVQLGRLQLLLKQTEVLLQSNTGYPDHRVELENLLNLLRIFCRSQDMLRVIGVIDNTTLAAAKVAMTANHATLHQLKELVDRVQLLSRSEAILEMQRFCDHYERERVSLVRQAALDQTRIQTLYRSLQVGLGKLEQMASIFAPKSVNPKLLHFLSLQQSELVLFTARMRDEEAVRVVQEITILNDYTLPVVGDLGKYAQRCLTALQAKCAALESEINGVTLAYERHSALMFFGKIQLALEEHGHGIDKKRYAQISNEIAKRKRQLITDSMAQQRFDLRGLAKFSNDLDLELNIEGTSKTPAQSIMVPARSTTTPLDHYRTLETLLKTLQSMVEFPLVAELGAEEADRLLAEHFVCTWHLTTGYAKQEVISPARLKAVSQSPLMLRVLESHPEVHQLVREWLISTETIHKSIALWFMLAWTASQYAALVRAQKNPSYMLQYHAAINIIRAISFFATFIKDDAMELKDIGAEGKSIVKATFELANWAIRSCYMGEQVSPIVQTLATNCREGIVTFVLAVNGAAKSTVPRLLLAQEFVSQHSAPHVPPAPAQVIAELKESLGATPEEIMAYLAEEEVTLGMTLYEALDLYKLDSNGAHRLLQVTVEKVDLLRRDFSIIIETGIELQGLSDKLRQYKELANQLQSLAKLAQYRAKVHQNSQFIEFVQLVVNAPADGPFGALQKQAKLFLKQRDEVQQLIDELLEGMGAVLVVKAAVKPLLAAWSKQIDEALPKLVGQVTLFEDIGERGCDAILADVRQMVANYNSQNVVIGWDDKQHEYLTDKTKEELWMLANAIKDKSDKGDMTLLQLFQHYKELEHWLEAQLLEEKLAYFQRSFAAHVEKLGEGLARLSEDNKQAEVLKRRLEAIGEQPPTTLPEIEAAKSAFMIWGKALAMAELVAKARKNLGKVTDQSELEARLQAIGEMQVTALGDEEAVRNALGHWQQELEEAVRLASRREMHQVKVARFREAYTQKLAAYQESGGNDAQYAELLTGFEDSLNTLQTMSLTNQGAADWAMNKWRNDFAAFPAFADWQTGIAFRVSVQTLRQDYAARDAALNKLPDTWAAYKEAYATHLATLGKELGDIETQAALPIPKVAALTQSTAAWCAKFAQTKAVEMAVARAQEFAGLPEYHRHAREQCAAQPHQDLPAYAALQQAIAEAEKALSTQLQKFKKIDDEAQVAKLGELMDAWKRKLVEAQAAFAEASSAHAKEIEEERARYEADTQRMLAEERERIYRELEAQRVLKIQRIAVQTAQAEARVALNIKLSAMLVRIHIVLEQISQLDKSIHCDVRNFHIARDAFMQLLALDGDSYDFNFANRNLAEADRSFAQLKQELEGHLHSRQLSQPVSELPLTIPPELQRGGDALRAARQHLMGLRPAIFTVELDSQGEWVGKVNHYLAATLEFHNRRDAFNQAVLLLKEGIASLEDRPPVHNQLAPLVRPRPDAASTVARPPLSAAPSQPPMMVVQRPPRPVSDNNTIQTAEDLKKVLGIGQLATPAPAAVRPLVRPVLPAPVYTPAVTKPVVPEPVSPPAPIPPVVPEPTTVGSPAPTPSSAALTPGAASTTAAEPAVAQAPRHLLVVLATLNKWKERLDKPENTNKVIQDFRILTQARLDMLNDLAEANLGEVKEEAQIAKTIDLLRNDALKHLVTLRMKASRAINKSESLANRNEHKSMKAFRTYLDDLEKEVIKFDETAVLDFLQQFEWVEGEYAKIEDALSKAIISAVRVQPAAIAEVVYPPRPPQAVVPQFYPVQLLPTQAMASQFYHVPPGPTPQMMLAPAAQYMNAGAVPYHERTAAPHQHRPNYYMVPQVYNPYTVPIGYPQPQPQGPYRVQQVRGNPPQQTQYRPQQWPPANGML